MFGMNKKAESGKVYKYPIFAFRSYSDYEFEGKKCFGFEVSLNEQIIANVELLVYDFNNEEYARKYYTMSKAEVNKIIDIINRNKRVFDCSSYLDNNSLTGDAYKFTFSTESRNRMIETWGFGDNFDNTKDSEDYKQLYMENIRQEQIIRKAFNEIVEVFKANGFNLSLDDFSTDVKETSY